MSIVDFSWGRPGAAALAAAGVDTVVRYLTRDTTGKRLTLEEVEAYTNAGIRIVGVFQDSAARARSGFAAGRADAQLALTQARSLGWSGSGAIYFAVDFDVQPADIPQIVDYFRGVCEVIPLENVGIYGDYDAMEAIRREDLATYFWQAGARSWSSGRTFPWAHMIQLVGGPAINGSAVDYNERRALDVGEWGEIKMSAEDVRGQIKAELDEATAFGFASYAEMFKSPTGIVEMLRQIYNAIGLARGTQISDQVGLVGLAVSQSSADGLALAAQISEQLRDIAEQLDRVIAGLGALGGGTPPPDPVVDPSQFADALLDALVERLSGGLAPRSLLVPRVSQEDGSASTLDASAPAERSAGPRTPAAGPRTPTDLPVIDPQNPLGVGEPQNPLGVGEEWVG